MKFIHIFRCRFVAKSNGISQGNYPHGNITYDITQVDHSGSFNKEEGIFVAPVTGLYYFQFNGQSYGKYDSAIEVLVNGFSVQAFYAEENSTQERQLSTFWTLNLEEYDEVTIHIKYTYSFYVTNHSPMYFMGFLFNV